MKTIYIDTCMSKNGVLHTVCYGDYITTFEGTLKELASFIEQIATKDDNIYIDKHGFGNGSYSALIELGYNAKPSKRHKVEFVTTQTPICLLKTIGA